MTGFSPLEPAMQNKEGCIYNPLISSHLSPIPGWGGIFLFEQGSVPEIGV
jgi:hypothetical protein